MRLYIRHAEKKHKNGDTNSAQPFDPEITESGKAKTSSLTENLYKIYGFPTLIVCSPFLRTRQTAIEIQNKLLTLTGEKVPIVVDVEVGEYLGNHSKQFSFTVETESYCPKIDRSLQDLDFRIRNHNDRMRALDKEDFNFWVVTHGVVIKRLARFNGVSMRGSPNFLSGMSIRCKGCDSGFIPSRRRNRKQKEILTPSEGFNPATDSRILEKIGDWICPKFKS
ncbi:phosphoglycerate mutase [Pithovirus sibericum]|uniref:Phosphoglycerate mutase n=1 Tax=Pithovirus sibericum TaxID=1450746 RepID=W5S5M8_9VIRU|nr:phosphoglycerate mutase [Pithovirus sibericum]AHH01582.1 phosphoglycerate mutase [Pithovirus sibericum]